MRVGLHRDGAAPAVTPSTISVIVCAHNEAGWIAACVHSLLAQTRPHDEVLVIDNASTDDTADLVRAIPGVRVVTEPRKGLVVARERGRRAAQGDVLVYVDADCRAPVDWLRRVERRFAADPALAALSAPYRFYDWHRAGRLLIRAYDLTVAPLTQVLVKHVLGIGTLFYGGNFAVRRAALDAIGGFDTSIDFHGEDTNLGRRLSRTGKVIFVTDCWLHTSARRYIALGTRAVLGIYIRNFTSELLRGRPRDTTHVDVRT